MLSSLGEVHFIDLFAFEEAALSALAVSKCPIVVCASPVVRDIVALIRGQNDFLSVGIEHGFAPWKAYTYSADLLRYDYYLSPTTLWAERLISLYTPRAGQVRIGGYPRVDALREMLNIKSLIPIEALNVPYWKGVAKGRRKLVIFSWGVDASALSHLPDSNEIVYLLHPAEEELLAKLRFLNASAAISSPDTVATLLAHAGTIAGDFSSMTFEAIHLGLPTCFFICRELYRSNCDMSETFFDRNNFKFAHIPHTPHQFDTLRILDLDDLRAILNNEVPEKEDVMQASLPTSQLPEGFLPPQNQDSRYIIASIISDIAYKQKPATLASVCDEYERLSIVRILIFLARTYQTILRRKPDLVGLFHYVRKLSTSPDPLPVRAMKFYLELLQSKEGRLKSADIDFGWPKIEFSVLSKSSSMAAPDLTSPEKGRS